MPAESVQTAQSVQSARSARPVFGGFASLHPALSIAYFMCVIAVTVFVPHPVVLGCSLCGALLLCVKLRGGRATVKLLAGLLPLAAFAAAINPLFNHQGATIIGYLGRSPLTRESLLYGAALACMLIAVLLWFSCYNLVVTSEKFLAVFGGIIPSLALVISMALSFVPRYLRQLKAIAAAQRGLGRSSLRYSAGSPSPGGAPYLRTSTAKRVLLRFQSLPAQLRGSFALLSILTSWALESALDTADSMRARGWGLPGRNRYQPLQFCARDACALALTLACATPVIVALSSGIVSAQYLPNFLLNQGAAGLPSGARTALIACAYGAFALLCAAPVLLELREELAWRISRLSI